ncbi:MAG: hypothetical protein AB8B79_10860 [Granulosicoccus sp.]
MARSFPQLVIIAPLLVAGTQVWAGDVGGTLNPFGFDPAKLDPIRFSRTEGNDTRTPEFNKDIGLPDSPGYSWATRQTEFSFKLKPKRPDFSRKGAYGLDIFKQPHLDVQSRMIDSSGLSGSVTLLSEGFEYSAGIRVEHEDADIDGTAYVSSSLLGLSYGRLGRLWYGGIDVNLEQFANDLYGEDYPDVLSLDVTTGRRLGFTGLTAESPLWLLSVQGNFDVHDVENSSDLETTRAWFLNPSLFWQQPGFTFSAQMQLPVEIETVDSEEAPDYRLRAVFEKQFK